MIGDNRYWKSQYLLSPSCFRVHVHYNFDVYDPWNQNYVLIYLICNLNENSSSAHQVADRYCIDTRDIPGLKKWEQFKIVLLFMDHPVPIVYFPQKMH